MVGSPELKLFKNSLCTIECDKDISENYVIYSPISTCNVEGNYKTSIFVKNVGTHTTYNIDLLLLASDKDISISRFKDTLSANEIQKIDLSYPLTKGEIGSFKHSLKLNYTCLP